MSGYVEDGSGAYVRGALVSVSHEQTGRRFADHTDSSGFFVFPALPAGPYTVSVSHSGFMNAVQSGVPVRVAGESTVRLVLLPGVETQTIQVRGRTEGGGTTGSYGFFDNRVLVQLPTNGRDYGRFSLLSPGAVLRSGAIADITFTGLPSTVNTFTLDGVDATRVDLPYLANGNERGARLLTGSLDGIAEFRAQVANYRAEYGRAAGAEVSILSRSGGANWHGSAIHYFRNDLFDARNFFNIPPARQSPFRYNNFGGQAGGPLSQKSFLFASYEGSRQRLGIVGTGTVPSRAFRSAVLSASPVLEPLLSQFPLGTAATTDPRVDLYTAAGVLGVREDSASARFDHYWSAAQRSFARLNVNETEAAGPMFAVTAAAIGVADRQFVPIRTINGVWNHTAVFSPRTVVEWTAGLQRWQSITDQLAPLPLTSVAGLTAAPGSRGASRLHSTVMQGGGQLSWSRGRHTWKSGATVWQSASNTSSESQLSLTYSSLNDFAANLPAQAQITARDPGSGRRQTLLGSFLQDTWQPGRSVTVDYGLRWDFAPPNHGDTPRYRSFDPRLQDLGAPGAPWYATNWKNLSPRFALAWQPGGVWQIRAGYGLFRQVMPVGIGVTIPLNTIPGTATFLRADNPGLRWPIDADLTQGIRPLPAVTGFHWDKPDLYSQQWNFTLAANLSPTLVAEAAYLGNRGINLRRVRNLNLIDPARGARPMPQFSTVNVDYADGQSVYHALQLGVTQHYGRGLQGSLRYSFAKAIDDVQDFAFGAPSPQNLLCGGRCERGPGSTDVRHTLTLQWVYAIRGTRRAAFLTHGWQVAGLGLFRTGLAAPITQGVNTSGDGNLTNQRPNAVTGATLSALRPSPEGWYNPAALSVPPIGTFGNLGRNSGRGPSFSQVDASLSKTVPLTERQSLQLRADGFNLCNHPNFDLPNGVFGTPSFGRILNTVGRTMGFGTARQVQLSVRWQF
ncbi:MAG TPA: carboxypeptidase regulatory-like domain-containing protein [Bryobacteraceae bacterium]|nr:carboxypeptidase regulatory-like domain-containing protein [Bryobacteraceae bacterium]